MTPLLVAILADSLSLRLLLTILPFAPLRSSGLALSHWRIWAASILRRLMWRAALSARSGSMGRASFSRWRASMAWAAASSLVARSLNSARVPLLALLALLGN